MKILFTLFFVRIFFRALKKNHFISVSTCVFCINFYCRGCFFLFLFKWFSFILYAGFLFAVILARSISLVAHNHGNHSAFFTVFNFICCSWLRISSRSQYIAIASRLGLFKADDRTQWFGYSFFCVVLTRIRRRPQTKGAVKKQSVQLHRKTIHFNKSV